MDPIAMSRINVLRNPITPQMTTKHRILMIEIKRNIAPYKLAFPEDAFKGGALIEFCGFDAFVANAEKWKNEFDIFVMSELTSVSYTCKVTPTEIKNAMKIFMDAGVKFLWYPNKTGFLIRKYGANGSIDSAQNADIQDLFDGLYLENQKNFIGTGEIIHNSDYPFGDIEIMRPGCVPNGNYMCNYSSTDFDTVFPLIAVEGETVAKITAYKPGKFFICSDAASVLNSDINTMPFWKYVYGWEIIRILLGKKTNVRLALDSHSGRRVAAVGVDCDVTNEKDAIKAFARAFKGKPLELGIVATKTTDNIAGFYRELTFREKFELVSHTYSHYSNDYRVTVTDESHVIGADQLIRIYQPFRARITSVTINATTITLNSEDVETGNPSATQYCINTDWFGTDYSADGILKFHVDNIGETVLISYTCDNEYQENLGSIEELKKKGCITIPCLYQTGGYTSIHPTTFRTADYTGVILCAYEYFPGYRICYNISRQLSKYPIPMGTIMKPGYNEAIVDVQFFKKTKEYLKTEYFPMSIQRCKDLEIPYLFYVHDFPLTEFAENSLFVSSTYDPDWKKATYSETLAYAEELYAWLVEQFDNENAYWMTRSRYVERYYYLNKYLHYDVKEGETQTIIIVRNTGREKVEGLTFRVPLEQNPESVFLSDNVPVDYFYESGLVTVWFDLDPGQGATLVLRR